MDDEQTLITAPRSLNARPFNRMIAVASGKGGVGKTWFSITLAHALSGLKQKTLLFDGDLGMANVDIQLGLMVPHDLGSVVTGTTTLNQVVHYCDKCRFDVIAGRSGSAGLAVMPVGRLQILAEDLALLAGSYDKSNFRYGSRGRKIDSYFVGNVGTGGGRLHRRADCSYRRLRFC